MMTFLKRLFHIHHWEYTKAVYANELMERLSIPQQHKRRICNKCGKIQVQHRHCLGLNPPEYINTWNNL